jgi:hypothetical protein
VLLLAPRDADSLQEYGWIDTPVNHARIMMLAKLKGRQWIKLIAPALVDRIASQAIKVGK